MEFTLTGFQQEREIRHYTFQSLEGGRTSRGLTVNVDVGLLRKYGIALQDVPLLCRRLLEKQSLDPSVKVLTFSEELMREHADHCEALKRAAEERKKAYRHHRSPEAGKGWH
jgi:hypothetical protein